VLGATMPPAALDLAEMHALAKGHTNEPNVTIPESRAPTGGRPPPPRGPARPPPKAGPQPPPPPPPQWGPSPLPPSPLCRHPLGSCCPATPDLKEAMHRVVAQERDRKREAPPPPSPTMLCPTYGAGGGGDVGEWLSAAA
jgi:hypothetical protein